MNDYEDLLSIGEVSGICRMSVKALRYYDKVGLIKPAYVDSTNKYRYYSKRQLPFIVYVREMRLKGFTLEEILRCFEVENGEKVFKWQKVVNLIDEKLVQITEQMEKLLKAQQQFNEWKELYIETDLQNLKSGTLKVKYIPERIVAFTRSRTQYIYDIMNARVLELINLVHEHNLHHKGHIMSIFHDDYTAVDFMNADIELCWEVLTEKPLEYSFIREIPVGLYVSVIHKGDYNSLLTEIYPILFDWIKENGYQVTGPAVWVYHVSVQNAQSPEQYITEVQVPVIK